LVENPQLPEDARSTEYKKDIWSLTLREEYSLFRAFENRGSRSLSGE
jgi:hypothetical protein